MASATGWPRAILAIGVRPKLWVTAIRQMFSLAPTGWWRKAPFLPLPASDYLAFRMQTAYGDADHPPVAADLVTYLEWCRSWRKR